MDVYVDYEDLDPFVVCMSALANAIQSGLDMDDLWDACCVANSAEEFDIAVDTAILFKETFIWE